MSNTWAIGFYKITLFFLIQAKLAARRARRLQESQRRSDENEAQRLMAEQNKQLRSGGVTSTDMPPDTDLSHVPDVKYAESAEGKALKNQHVSFFYEI